MNNKIYISAIIAAAGKGTRMNTEVSKQFIKLNGIPVLAKTLRVFESADKIDEIIIVTGREDISYVSKLVKEYGITKLSAIVEGGATRQESVYNGLLKARGNIVLIHDGARPFVEAEKINSLTDVLKEYDGAALGIPVTDTLKVTDENGAIKGTVDRCGLYSIQTPQGFKKEVIIKAHKRAMSDGLEVTDDCALCESMGIKVKVVKGSSTNIKITYPDDLKIAKGINSEKEEKKMRVGMGYDVHKLVEGRDLFLGGVKIPHNLGLLGHSDADVLLHSIMDAMLGAAALGDIGMHFPDTDEKWKGADSKELLAAVCGILEDAGVRVVNIDATVIAQKPKLAPYIPEMRKTICKILKITEENVNVKATTTEHLGFCGREEGIAAEAICMINQVR